MRELLLLGMFIEKIVLITYYGTIALFLGLISRAISIGDYTYRFWHTFWSELFDPSDDIEKLQPAVYLLVGAFVGSAGTVAAFDLPTSQGGYLLGGSGLLCFIMGPWLSFEIRRRNYVPKGRSEKE